MSSLRRRPRTGHPHQRRGRPVLAAIQGNRYGGRGRRLGDPRGLETRDGPKASAPGKEGDDEEVLPRVRLLPAAGPAPPIDADAGVAEAGTKSPNRRQSYLRAAEAVRARKLWRDDRPVADTLTPPNKVGGASTAKSLFCIDLAGKNYVALRDTESERLAKFVQRC